MALGRDPAVIQTGGTVVPVGNPNHHSGRQNRCARQTSLHKHSYFNEICTKKTS